MGFTHIGAQHCSEPVWFRMSSKSDALLNELRPPIERLVRKQNSPQPAWFNQSYLRIFRNIDDRESQPIGATVVPTEDFAPHIAAKATSSSATEDGIAAADTTVDASLKNPQANN